MNVQGLTLSLSSFNRPKSYAIGVLLTALVSVVSAVIALHTPTPLQAAASPTTTAAKADSVALPPVVHQEILSRYGQVPLHFEPNRGQTAGDVHFLARGPGYALFLTPQEVVWHLHSPGKAQAERNLPPAAAESTEAAVVRMGFVGAADSPSVLTGLDPQPGRSNYFIGSDPQHWHTAVPHYGQVHYKDVYPGIDLVLYGNPRHLEYDFVVAPGVDPTQIRLTFRGIDSLRVDDRGQLVLQAPGGELVHQSPQIYQIINGERRPVAGRYVLQESAEVDAALPTVGFQLADYDSKAPLVIDPSLVYSTYLGGGNNEEGMGIAVDTAGNAYVTGYTYSTDFPTANPLQSGNRGARDIFVTKLDTTGQTLVYSTFLGGNGRDEGNSIAVDTAGNAYLTGYTQSNDFPTTAQALQPNLRGYQNAFVTKLDTTGQTLVYSTFLGGNGGDEGNSIAVDATGNAYLTGSTESTDFPTAQALQSNYHGGGDAFVTKLDATGRNLIYSTFLGGNDWDGAYSIAVDTAGNAYLTGETYSVDFPIAQALQPNNRGGWDAFITKLDATGRILLYSTYWGGSDQDRGNGIAVDATGKAYITGYTASTDFSIANALQPDKRGSWDAFVMKLDATGQTLLYSTYLGGNGIIPGYNNDEGDSIAVDTAGNAYITGYTDSTDFPIANALQSNLRGYGDAFVTKLDATGRTLIYSTYLGGNSDEEGLGIAIDTTGNAYVTGYTQSTDFPTTQALQPGYRGGAEDAFITRISSASSLSPLTVIKAGIGTGTVTSSPAGIDCGSDCTENYTNGTLVTLTATAATGSSFTGWSGACTGMGNCQVTMSQARTVTAHFYTTPYTLTVGKAGTGLGMVTSNPSGINCGSDCTEDYPSGATVALTATPMMGYTFAGWSGACAGTGTCQVTMDQVRTVTATFNSPSAPNDNFADATVLQLPTGMPSLNVNGNNRSASKETGEPTHAGNSGGHSVWWKWTAPTAGNVSISTYGSNFDTLLGVYVGTQVTALTPVASNDDSYGGDGTSSVYFPVTAGTTYYIAVDGYNGATGEITLYLYLSGQNYTLTVSKTGSGTVTSDDSYGMINCGYQCTASYASGTVVTLTATPATGSIFVGWGGACTGTGATCQVTMSQICKVTATFSVSPGTNDNFANATVVQFTGNSSYIAVNGNNRGTTKETGEPDHAGNSGGHSVWWKWTAPTAGNVSISTYNSNFDTLLGVYIGTQVTALTAVTSNDDAGGITSSVYFPVTAGRTYYIAVDGYEGATGDITLNLSLNQQLTVTKVGTGSGTVTSGEQYGMINCGYQCSASYNNGTVVTLTATPATGSIFAGWSGDCTGIGTCQVTMNQTKKVTATFNRATDTFVLTVATTGTGTGTVTSQPAGINCGSDCTEIYGGGTVVTLTATPATGSTFAGWSGGACNGTGVCQVTMSQARSVTATFNLSCPNDRDCDGIPDAVEIDQGTNPDVKDNDIFTNPRLFVMQQYRDFLRREGEPGDVTYWEQQLAGGAVDRAGVVDLFLTSPEFEGRVAPLVRLYMAYFLRQPDYDGLWYWVGQLSSGMTLPAISQAFADSAEFQQRYGALDCNGFLTLVYQNVLGRNPDAGGLAYWQGQLCGGALTRGEVMLAFAQSAEYQQQTAPQVLAVMLYVGLLRRDPETAGFNYWVGQLQAGMARRDVLNAFLTSPEYRQRFLP